VILDLHQVTARKTASQSALNEFKAAQKTVPMALTNCIIVLKVPEVRPISQTLNLFWVGGEKENQKLQLKKSPTYPERGVS
jgi:hypothetical protein